MPCVVTETGLSVILDGRPHIVPRSHPEWEHLFEARWNDSKLKEILNPAAAFAVGSTWLTRSGDTAEVLAVSGKTVTVLVDDCYEMDLILGRVVVGEELPEDLIECTSTKSTCVE